MDNLQRPKSCISNRNVSPGQFRRCLTPTHEIRMTTEGLRSMRIDNQQMSKYRPKSAIELTHRSTKKMKEGYKSQRCSSNPLHVHDQNQRQLLEGRPSSSNRSLIFTTRNTDCKPSLITSFPNRDFELIAKERKGPTFYEKRNKYHLRTQRVAHEAAKLSKYQSSSLKHCKIIPHVEPCSAAEQNHSQFFLGVARIYSPKQTRDLKQKRYQEVLDYEFAKRWLTKELKEKQRIQLWKEYNRYHEYIMELNKPSVNRFTRVHHFHAHPKAKNRIAKEVTHLNVSSSNDSKSFHNIENGRNIPENAQHIGMNCSMDNNERFSNVKKWINNVNSDGIIHAPEWQRYPSIDTLPSCSETDNNEINKRTNQI